MQDPCKSYVSSFTTTRSRTLSNISLFASLCLVSGVIPMIAPVFTQVTRATPATQIAQAGQVLYVNPATGNDSAGGGRTADTSFKTISFALKQAQPGATIQLAPGSYTVESGETFPLIMPAGVTLQGDAGTKGQGIEIKGGGEYVSPSFARQNVVILAQGDSQIKGITVTNANTRGTALWIESGTPTVSDSTFAGSNRDGIFVSGTGNPKILNNTFTKNAGNGVSIAKKAQGEVRGNVFLETGFGLAIGGDSTPMVAANQITKNQDGIVVSDRARPVLRENTIEENTRDGIVAIANAQPDLGMAGTAGNNIIQKNKRHDLYNATRGPLVVAGNTLNPKKVSGQITFEEATQTVASGPLKDIQTHWAKPFIEALAAKKIVTGFPDGTYRPSEPVTRAQFATIITKAFAPQSKKPATTFKDIKSGYWAAQSIQAASQGGFMSGFPEGTFLPEQAIPRVQAIVALSSGLGLQGGDLSALSFYQDASNIPSYASAGVAAATQKKLVVNYPQVKVLNPIQNATRADVAAFVYQALVNAGKMPPVQSAYIVSP